MVYFRDPGIRMTELDDVDAKVRQWLDEDPTDVIFLSRHTAASGTPALCVHPIGVPVDGSEDYGGHRGVYPPPSSLIARLYRRLRREAKIHCTVTGEAFEASLEATHHGPTLSTPACFVEVGSGPDQYDQAAPAALWARILQEELLLGEVNVPSSEREVVVAIGGGHYMPRIGDYCASKKSKADESIFLGHMLASYTFRGLDGDDDLAWQRTVKAALASTRTAFPDVNRLSIRLEKKAFKSQPRSKLLAFLHDLPDLHVQLT